MLDALGINASTDSGRSDDALAQGMRHNDTQLHEMLSYARACLKTGRHPTDLREKDFFERFDAEALETQEAEKANMPAIEPRKPPTPPPIPKTPQNITPEARQAKLRRDVRDLMRAATQKRQELESVEKQYTQEVLHRCRVDDELRDAKTELRKAQREHAEMKEMIRLQEKEIKDLKIDIDISSSKATAALRAAEEKQKQHQQRSQVLALQYSRNQLPLAIQPATGTGNSLAKPQESSCFDSETHEETRQEVSTDRSIDELRSVLLPDKKPPEAEPTLWSHVQTENEKLVAVIDEIGELGRQIRTPLAREKVPEGSGGQTVANGSGGGGSAPAVSTFAPARKAPSGLAAILGLAEPPKSKPAYASVLAKRPKQHKVFMN